MPVLVLSGRWCCLIGIWRVLEGSRGCQNQWGLGLISDHGGRRCRHIPTVDA
ncbi:hypothetical protein M758_UG264600 [Ceratodon purpureus]|nr:hypothetical protein M758_UG264600 [Ceratodon purpureus]